MSRDVRFDEQKRFINLESREPLVDEVDEVDVSQIPLKNFQPTNPSTIDSGSANEIPFESTPSSALSETNETVNEGINRISRDDSSSPQSEEELAEWNDETVGEVNEEREHDQDTEEMVLEDQEDTRNTNEGEETALRRSGRNRRPREPYWVAPGQPNLLGAAISPELEDPLTINEANKRYDGKLWSEAAQMEYDSMQTNKVWDLVDIPAGRKPIGHRWVFKVKRDEAGRIVKYKARIVAKGYSQIPGTDFEETFAPVADWNSIRVVLTIAAADNMELVQWDVETAFLNGDIDKELYMTQPEGFVVHGKEGKVCRLNKAIYGLKQASRQWNIKLDNTLTKIGFTRSEADPCVYQGAIKGFQCIIVIWVDDMIAACVNQGILDYVRTQISKDFTLKNLGKLKYVLGIEILRDRKGKRIMLSQKQYLSKVLDRFGMGESRAVATPLEKDRHFVKNDTTTEDLKDYQSQIGSLMYAMIGTRPDLSFAVGVLSQHASNPGEEHLVGVKRILRYLKGTLNLGLVLDGSKGLTLTGYTDADYAGDIDTRCSTSGYLIKVGNSTCSWSSKKQRVVATSTMEAEYLGAYGCAQEVIWYRKLLQSLGKLPDSTSTTVFADNQSAINYAKGDSCRGKGKHIQVKYHFVRECMRKGEMELQYLQTDKMVADVFTKSLGKGKHELFTQSMGLVNEENFLQHIRSGSVETNRTAEEGTDCKAV